MRIKSTVRAVATPPTLPLLTLLLVTRSTLAWWQCLLSSLRVSLTLSCLTEILLLKVWRKMRGLSKSRFMSRRPWWCCSGLDWPQYGSVGLLHTLILGYLDLTPCLQDSSTLAFVVDSNPGRASSAIACNSLFRGVLAVSLYAPHRLLPHSFYRAAD